MAIGAAAPRSYLPDLVVVGDITCVDSGAGKRGAELVRQRFDDFKSFSGTGARAETTTFAAVNSGRSDLILPRNKRRNACIAAAAASSTLASRGCGGIERRAACGDLDLVG